MGGIRPYSPAKPQPPPLCSAANLARCQPACAAVRNTPVAMGGIHPRSKKPVGDRLGTAAFNTVYGGKVNNLLTPLNNLLTLCTAAR